MLLPGTLLENIAVSRPSASDAELRAAALDLPPSPVEVFFKTPIGPVLLINLAFLVTGFSWCDTPFGDPAACASLGK